LLFPSKVKLNQETNLNNTINNIDILIGKVISGNATSEEIAQLETWKSESLENVKIFDKSVKVWEISKSGISDNDLKKDKQTVDDSIKLYLTQKVRKIQRQSVLYKIAAILAFPMALAISFYYFSSRTKSVEQTRQICEIISPKGHISKCILPDGTEVWVNTGSTITYDAATFNHKTREIILSGEAYFDVARNIDKPFIVNTTIASINVTGTSFNIKSYPESGIFETVLSEGSIEMMLNGSAQKTVQLVPGERAMFDINKKGISIQKVDSEIFSAWRNGEIIFKDATLNDLIKELERIYNIRFQLKDKQLGDFRFRGMFSYNNNLIDALEKIKRTSGIGYYIENKEVWLSKK
jgi:transmembrane sensor